MDSYTDFNPDTGFTKQKYKRERRDIQERQGEK